MRKIIIILAIMLIIIGFAIYLNLSVLITDSPSSSDRPLTTISILNEDEQNKDYDFLSGDSGK